MKLQAAGKVYLAVRTAEGKPVRSSSSVALMPSHSI
jgi:hypothetical protein